MFKKDTSVNWAKDSKNMEFFTSKGGNPEDLKYSTVVHEATDEEISNILESVSINIKALKAKVEAKADALKEAYGVEAKMEVERLSILANKIEDMLTGDYGQDKAFIAVNDIPMPKVTRGRVASSKESISL